MQEDPMRDPTARDDATRGDAGGEDELGTFQDDMVTDDNVVDPITIEQQGENDDPVQILGVPQGELKAELDKRAFSGTEQPRGEGDPRSDADEGVYEGTEDDMREHIEDMDEDDKDNLPGS